MSHTPEDDWLREDPQAHDPSLADDVLAEPETEEEYAPPRRERRRRRRNPLVTWITVIVALGLVVGAGYVAVRQIAPMIPSFSFGGGGQDTDDYPGPGTGEVMVEIPAGAGGAQIGQILAEADVVASAGAFQAVATADSRATTIQPGTYRMAHQMSAAGALDRLVDSSYREVAGVTIREGLWAEEVFALLAEATGHEVEEYEAVDPADLDLPDAADGELEGYLFPDTYQFSPNATPQEQLQTMIDLGKQKFQELGLTDDDMARTLIVASIVQAEGRAADDLPKVARVIENRLEDSEPLGMDSTIHYLHRERGRAGTTDDQRAEESPYNTYLNQGLPPGPINNPGAAAIEAAMEPAEGDWRFFVTVNPDTGETVFTETYAEHQEYEAEFNEWCRENQDRC